MSNRKRFISVEGGEGAGKTTLIEGLSKLLREKGIRVVTTREPGGIPIAEQIRKVILDPANTLMEARTEALLYAAARRQHLVQKVIPALEEGAVVICDRFVDSSLAYQGYARGLGIEQVWAVNRFAVEGAMPMLTLWLDLEPEAGLRRIHSANEREINRLDLEELTFHQRVREGYQMVYERDTQRIIRLDAEKPQKALINEAFQIIEAKFGGLSAVDVK
ncbi:dTMP kinase [Paenibacillus humicola]|uniref:dTMP kinase n=1 Tax=Paenibacillus humicola TaxID=3110540 RepID=UPI00237AA3E5|nr:dTMP kinase [Paenibacillus humicola]